MHIDDLVSRVDRAKALAAGTLAMKTSPDGSKLLYCYTPQAQFQGAWSDATIKLRGVTVDAATGEILSRPFPKFFNYGDEKNAPKIGLDEKVYALDKMDGSLAVLQPDATMTSKGSFTSDVAVAATKLYQEKYRDKWRPVQGNTYCFEYTAPDNRIVLDYGPEPKLTLLGVVDNKDGWIYTPSVAVYDDGWTGPIAETIASGLTFREVLEMEPRENAEGLVIMSMRYHQRLLKLKQADYLAMHAIVTNTNARTVWEAMAVNDMIANGSTPEQLKKDLQMGPDRIERAMELGSNWLIKLSEGVPDEFHEWLVDTAYALDAEFHASKGDAYARVDDAAEDRGQVARELQEQYGDDALPWNISLDIWLNDGTLSSRSRSGLWRHVRPGHDTYGRMAREDKWDEWSPTASEETQ